MTGLHPELAGEFDRGLVRLRSTAEELYRAVLRGCDLEQQIGEAKSGRIGGHRRCREGDLFGLSRAGVDDRIQAVTEIDREDAGKPVDVRLAEDVRHPDAVSSFENQRVLCERLHLHEVNHDLRCVQFLLARDHHSRFSPSVRSAALSS